MKKPDLLNTQTEEYNKALDQLLYNYGVIKSILVLFVIISLIVCARLFVQKREINCLKGKIKQDSICVESYKQNINQQIK